MKFFFDLLSPSYVFLLAALVIVIVFCLGLWVKDIRSPKQFPVGPGVKMSKRTLKILTELGQDPTRMSRDQWKAVDTLESHSKSHWMVRSIYMVATIFFVLGFLSGLRNVYLMLSAICLYFIAQEFQRNIFEEHFRVATPMRTVLTPRPANPSWINWFAGFLILLGLLSGYRLYLLAKSWGTPHQSIENYRKHTGLEKLPLPSTPWVESEQGQKLTQTFHTIEVGWIGHFYAALSNGVGLSAFFVAWAFLKRSVTAPRIARLFAKSNIALNSVILIPVMIYITSLVSFSAATGTIPSWAALAYIAGLPIFILANFLVSNFLYIMLLIYMNRRNVNELFSGSSASESYSGATV